MVKKKGRGGGVSGEGNGPNPGGGGSSLVNNDPVVEEEVKNYGGGGVVVTVVLRVHINCNGCGKTVKDSLKGVMGIKKLTANIGTNKLTVVGKVDPVMTRDRVERKTRKKAELLSPLPKKDNEISPLPKKDNENKKDKDNPKEPQTSTVVLKIQLHCYGCTQRIRKRILGIKGVATVSMDTAKDLVTVKGIMDPKALPGVLMEKLKMPVEVVPPKKDNAGDKKEKLKKPVEVVPPKKDNAAAAAAAAAWSEGNKIEYCYSEYGNTPYYVQAPQYFSDENPNACSVM